MTDQQAFVWPVGRGANGAVAFFGHRVEADGSYTILSLYRLEGPGGARVTAPRMSAREAREWRDAAGGGWDRRTAQFARV